MPPVQIPAEDSSAFTIIHQDEDKREDAPPPRNVNVVKPLQHDEAPVPPHAAEDRLTVPPPPNTIFDPKFSRALDFKLRRLKEKEILQTNLRRPTRSRPNGTLAASNPDLGGGEARERGRAMSRSQPRLDAAASPGPRRRRPRVAPDAERPRFVTTVRAGRFLLPPPEIASLLGLEALYPAPERDRLVYSYASRPRAVAPRARRDLPPRQQNGHIPAGKDPTSETPTGESPAADPPAAPPPRASPGALFGGARALVAGVVGMQRLLDKPHAGGGGGGGGGGAAAPFANMMHDKRVVRGSTFGSHPHAAGDGIESAAARAARTRRRAAARRAAAARRPGTPPPAPGRRHHPIQTEYYLEELFDKGEEMEVGVQTDLFVDRPASPAHVPARTGADAHTQVYPGELFDFELEARPILEALVGATAERALAEVAQEEELATLREQQRRYAELRDAERAERARLAAQHARLRGERERRAAEARRAAAAARGAADRAAAATLVRGYIAELLPSVLAGLRDQGYLVDRIQRGVDEEFVPWLEAEVSQEIEAIITSRDVISEIVREVVEARAEMYRSTGERAPSTEPRPDSVTPPSELLDEEETPTALDE